MSWGQKIKYKDLFFLIHKSKKYDQGEPFLRSFLSNPKNTNHANANFQMAVIHEINAKKKDVLTENSEKVTLLDSAIYFYSKSKSLMTEKEVKKNSDYYEDDFMRRDLRTGKMGIKVSDVELDLEERVNNIKEEMSNLKLVDQHFSTSKSEYQRAFELYADLVQKYESQRTFYLRADDEVIGICDEIKMAYDTAMGNFGSYKLRIAKIESNSYDQSLKVSKIEDIIADVSNKADFFAESVEVYDLSGWVSQVKTTVIDQIRPIKKKLVAYDQRLDKTREQLFKDSVSVAAKIMLEKDDEFYKELEAIDKQAMPLRLLDLKQEELKYWSFIFENKEDKDSSNINYQVLMAANELEGINSVDSLANVLLGYNLTVEAENYQDYISTQYEGVAGIQRFLRQKLDFAQAEKKYRTTILEAKIERSRWLIYGNDSIPLFKRDSSIALTDNGKTQYDMLGGSLSDNPTQFTHGIKYDPLGGTYAYISVMPDSLSVSELATYKMDKAIFSIEKSADLGVMEVRDETLNLTYVLYYDNSIYEEKAIKSQLTCISSSGTVLWSESLDLVYPPANIALYDKGGVAINYDVKYIDTENSDKLVSRLLVSTDGKVLN